MPLEEDRRSRTRLSDFSSLTKWSSTVESAASAGLGRVLQQPVSAIKLPHMRKLRLLSVLVSTLIVSANSSAANHCNAEVKPIASESNSAGTWTLRFRVKTQCAVSTGRFAYSYMATQGSENSVVAGSGGWKASDGSDFEVREDVPLSKGVHLSDLKVVASSIESTDADVKARRSN